VQVTGKSGTPIRRLQKQDFTLLDDRQPQNILSFHAVDDAAVSTADPPVEIVLVVDAVNASFQAVNYERSEIKKFSAAEWRQASAASVARHLFRHRHQDPGRFLSRWKCSGSAL
jgi:hypothetical protein